MNYFQITNLPNKNARGVLTDYRISPETVRELGLLGIETLKTQRIANLYDAVCGHTDMQIHHLGGNKFVTAPEVYDYYKNLLNDAEIIKGSKFLSGKYPDDICYNAAGLGGILICSAAYTAAEIVSEYKTIINVNQGYAKCSICIVNENAIITSDKGIYEAAKRSGIDVLKIEPGYIKLKNMSYGFIGGATGLIAPNMLAVNGDIKTHKNCEDIILFCKNYGVEVISLKKGEIEDIGTIIPLFL